MKVNHKPVYYRSTNPAEEANLHTSLAYIAQNATTPETKDTAVLALLAMDTSRLDSGSLVNGVNDIAEHFFKLEIALDSKDKNGAYKFLDAIAKANPNIQRSILRAADLQDSDFMTKVISKLLKSEKDKEFAFELINRGAARIGTEETLLSQIDSESIKRAISSGISNGKLGGINGKEFNINNDLFKQLRDVYFAREDVAPEEKSRVFKEAIDHLTYSKDDKTKAKAQEIVMDMALHGYELNKDGIYSLGMNAVGNASVIGKEILDNKSIFSDAKLTDNDAKRVAILSSALATGYFKNEEKQAEYIRTNPGVSPLKLAIDTKQFELATKMIQSGFTLKPQELSIGRRFQNAIGMLGKEVIIRLSEAKLHTAKKSHPKHVRGAKNPQEQDGIAK